MSPMCHAAFIVHFYLMGEKEEAERFLLQAMVPFSSSLFLQNVYRVLVVGRWLWHLSFFSSLFFDYSGKVGSSCSSKATARTRD